MRFVPLIALIFAARQLPAEETIEAPGFEGEFLGLSIAAEHLGVVLDISESMNRQLPNLRTALREKLPRTPVLHVDGCALEKPGPQATVRGGVASETVTAVDLLGRFAHASAILWISDLGDPPNRAGIEAMAGILSKHEITLYVLSVKNRPGPAIRELVEVTEGAWKIVELDSPQSD